MRKFWDNPNSAGPQTGQPLVVPPFARLFPESLKIGGVEIRPATVLAPMAGVTDTVFRRFIKNLGGCGLIMTEFTSADGMLRDSRVRGRYLHFYEDEHPISAQLFGSNPGVLAEAAKMVEGLGFDLVDLNLGCPAKKVVKCNGGSGLLRDLPLIKSIFESVRAAVKIPFTVKFRAGWNDDEIVCVELARMAQDCGLGAVALHARTREQGYSGTARWEWIASVKQAVKIPVIGNGDIRTPEDACAMVAQTGCDAVMIGRSAPSNPWIFRQIEQYVSNQPSAINRRPACHPEAHDFGAEEPVPSSPRESGRVAKPLPSCHSEPGVPDTPTFGVTGWELSAAEPARRGGARNLQSSTSTTAFRAVTEPAVPAFAHPYDEPTETDRFQMIKTYFEMLLEEEMPGAEGKMKQFASWFTHGVPGGAALRKAIYEAKTGSGILASVEEFFEARSQTVR